MPDVMYCVVVPAIYANEEPRVEGMAIAWPGRVAWDMTR